MEILFRVFFKILIFVLINGLKFNLVMILIIEVGIFGIVYIIVVNIIKSSDVEKLWEWICVSSFFLFVLGFKNNCIFVWYFKYNW